MSAAKNLCRASVMMFLATFAEPGMAQSIKGSVLEPSKANLAQTWAGASVTLPAGMAGPAIWQGKLDEMPAIERPGRAPVVILMHGSSGNAPAIKTYQRWLADDLGLASIAPDSLAIPDRLTYKSPIGKTTYERVHALRLAELKNAIEEASKLSFVDTGRIIVVGTSEGSVPVARLDDPRPSARIIYSWSCEDNYFVEAARTAIPHETPVLSMIAARDPYFSAENPWNKDYSIKGTCTQALKSQASAMVVTLATNVHTILNYPEAHDVTKSFIQRVLALPSR